MKLDDKKLIRAIVRRVHPDLFSAHPYERAQNSESLMLLNSYVDELQRRGKVQTATVNFWVIEDGRLTQLSAELPGYGSLGPLFYAFNLISADEMQSGAGSYISSQDSTDFLEWLSFTVREALRASEQHESMKRVIRELRASLEDKFGLAAIQVGGEFAVSKAEQKRQIEALRTLNSCLTTLAADQPQLFDGLSIRLYHPDSAPFDTSSFLDNSGSYNLRTNCIESYVADDGCLHIVADRHRIQEAVSRLDLGRARLLTRLSLFWVHRVRQLSPPLKALLGTDNVWCDSRTEEGSQKFVLWAGCILERREEFERVLGRRQFAFSLLVHSDESSAMVDFLATSSVLQVRSDCPPARLLEFLAGESGLAANEAAESVASSKAEEEALLEKVRDALGAKHVICVCSSYDSASVMDAAQRLLDCVDVLRGVVDLSGASIAIDDCYELWESGFISIPHNFQVKDLRPELRKLLSPSNASPSGTGDSMQQGDTSSASDISPRGNGAGDVAASAGAEAAPSAASRSAEFGAEQCFQSNKVGIVKDVLSAAPLLLEVSVTAKLLKGSINAYMSAGDVIGHTQF
ncbi:hypothetical protein WJX75_009812 [Coccomyxa subellipsoidea]|uniref:DUF4460 domain-containing protein n=1 Tax=Coccomyxa subellipsoidea TaxID=248742 RepID=A0ABR2YBR6_9CHLO